jgi:hypothetical protein
MGSIAGVALDKRTIEKLAQDAARQAAREAQPLLDELHAKHGGEPVEQVEPHVRALFRRLNWTPDSTSEIAEYAQTIASGTRIVLRPAKVRL